MVHHRRTPLLIWYALALHFFWAVAFILDSAAANSTALHAIVAIFHEYSSFVLIVAVALSVLGLFVPQGRKLSILLMIPQQILLFIASTGAIIAIYHGHYADLVIRPQLFIAADQAPIILAAIFYTVAMIQVARSKHE
jgi:hypothetical protein